MIAAAGAARLVDARDVEVAFLLVLDDFASSSDCRPAPLRKPCTACSGAPTRGPLRSSDTAGDFFGTSAITSAKRRGVERRFAYLEAARFQAVDHQPAQVFRRARLQARGDLFGKQLEQQLGHWS